MDVVGRCTKVNLIKSQFWDIDFLDIPFLNCERNLAVIAYKESLIINEANFIGGKQRGLSYPKRERLY